MLIKIVLIILICTTIGELVALVGMVVHWRRIREQRMAPKQHRLCIPREIFISADDNEEMLKSLTEEYDQNKNITKQCGNTSDILDILVKQTVADKYNGNANPELTNLDLKDYNCTHSQGKQQMVQLMDVTSYAKPVPGKSTKLFWKSSKRSFTSPGLRYLEQEGAIFVETAGRYYISSQLTMTVEKRTESMNTDDTADQTFRHIVNMISIKEGNERILLEDAKSTCNMVVEESKETSTMGAVFNLEESDRIYVATSHPHQLVSDHHSNYFSVHSA